ncbi:dephospho-CoA kinase [Pedobacter cryoconitis]|uniref:Dephospho-CoA kinase n=1 Tax=Pedobacter cryoconitis TaxID=188932 RepID=A0A7X0J3K6_9SPHI|nr:dephospho-CoA kinase [Pedobacter cryoconitis]MBB6500034.1 dephospho-CoA kinase [Pedobacter cryoconitis]
MLKIGITGGIGSGKSTVCRIFETLGIPVFYADTVAKEIMVTDPVLMEGISKTFGEESYTGGKLNNKHIAGIVFNNKEELAKLNALVHPAVFRAFDTWEETISADVPYTLKEAALLFESGSYRLCDKNILVTAPKEVKIQRVMERDGASRAEVEARMDKQLGDEEKIKMADFLIRNEESQPVILQVLELHRQFINLTK